MATANQSLGEAGEIIVVKNCICPRCKRSGTLKRLPNNFKCADLICDFCGYLAQVKATRQSTIHELPDKLMGAAWGPQKERMDAGIYFPLFVTVVLKDDERKYAVFYLAPDLQMPDLFEPRRPLSAKAKRAGWQGFMYNLKSVRNSAVRLL